jgi:hypothetical protein
MKNNLTLDALNEQLFDTIDRIKSDAIDLDRARVISDISKNIVETYKVKANVLATASKTENPVLLEKIMGKTLLIEA